MSRLLFILAIVSLSLFVDSCGEPSSDGRRTVSIRPDSVSVQTSSVDTGDGWQPIVKSNCKTCHNKTMQAIGPSFLAIAQRYPDSPEHISLLAAKVKNGGTGVWGKQVMTPHPELEDRQIMSMVTYILSLDTQDKSSGDAGKMPSGAETHYSNAHSQVNVYRQ